MIKKSNSKLKSRNQRINTINPYSCVTYRMHNSHVIQEAKQRMEKRIVKKNAKTQHYGESDEEVTLTKKESKKVTKTEESVNLIIDSAKAGEGESTLPVKNIYLRLYDKDSPKSKKSKKKRQRVKRPKVKADKADNEEEQERPARSFFTILTKKRSKMQDYIKQLKVDKEVQAVDSEENKTSTKRSQPPINTILVSNENTFNNKGERLSDIQEPEPSPAKSEEKVVLPPPSVNVIEKEKPQPSLFNTDKNKTELVKEEPKPSLFSMNKPVEKTEDKPSTNMFQNKSSNLFFNTDNKDKVQVEEKPKEAPKEPQKESKVESSLFGPKPTLPFVTEKKDNNVSLFPVKTTNEVKETKVSQGLFDNKKPSLFNNNQSSLFPTKPIVEAQPKPTDNSKIETENEEKKHAIHPTIFGQEGSLFKNNQNTLFTNNNEKTTQNQLVQSSVMEMDENKKDAMEAYKDDSKVNKTVLNTQVIPNTTPPPMINTFNNTNTQNTGQSLFGNNPNSQSLFNNNDNAAPKPNRMFSFTDNGGDKNPSPTPNLSSNPFQSNMGQTNIAQTNNPLINNAKSQNSPSNFSQNQNKPSPSSNPFMNTTPANPLIGGNSLNNMANKSGANQMFKRNLSRSPEQQGIQDYMNDQKKQPTGNARMNQFNPNASLSSPQNLFGGSNKQPSQNLFNSQPQQGGGLFSNNTPNPNQANSLFGGSFNNNQNQGGGGLFSNTGGNGPSLFNNQGGNK